MFGTVKAKIGDVTVHSAAGKAEKLQALFPEDVQVDVVGLGLLPDDRTVGSLYDLQGTKGIYLSWVPKLAAERYWHAVVISGQPVALLNPGLLQELQARLEIPVTNQMVSSIAAIKSVGAVRVLSISPYDEGLDKMVRDYFANSGIEVVPPASKPFPNFGEASKLNDEDIFLFTKQALEGLKNIQAVYIQSILKRLPIFERIEEELDTTVVSGDLASLWYLLSRLGLSYHLRGSGKFLYEWPKVLE